MPCGAYFCYVMRSVLSAVNPPCRRASLSRAVRFYNRHIKNVLLRAVENSYSVRSGGVLAAKRNIQNNVPLRNHGSRLASF